MITINPGDGCSLYYPLFLILGSFYRVKKKKIRCTLNRCKRPIFSPTSASIAINSFFCFPFSFLSCRSISTKVVYCLMSDFSFTCRTVIFLLFSESVFFISFESIWRALSKFCTKTHFYYLLNIAILVCTILYTDFKRVLLTLYSFTFIASCWIWSSSFFFSSFTVSDSVFQVSFSLKKNKNNNIINLIKYLITGKQKASWLLVSDNKISQNSIRQGFSLEVLFLLNKCSVKKLFYEVTFIIPWVTTLQLLQYNN